MGIYLGVRIRPAPTMVTQRTLGITCALLAPALLATYPRVGDAPRPSDACQSVPLAAVADSVAAAFDAHQFVFLGSTHGGDKPHLFLLCLVSRSSFQARAVDVLVEWANPVHQPLVDRYLLGLEPLPIDSLNHVWFDTDAPDLWARLPLIPLFYERVRAINRRLAPERRIRVIGGSEPVDWSRVETPADVARYPFKTNWAAHVILEHFAPHPERRLLVVYGDGHIHHDGGTLMSDLHSLDRDKRYVVGTIRSVDAAAPNAVARLGDPSRPFFRAASRLPRSGPYPEDLFYAREGALDRYVDAVAYLGPAPARDLRNQIDFSADRRAELQRREAIRGDRPELMRLRFGNRARWFEAHPHDLPPDPRGPTARP